MNKILTVTVPTYNVECYLKQCLSSFINPKWLNALEVLIIDDGSTDQSAAIAKEFVAAYPETFRLIQKENGGHGSTINRGMSEAKGTYFKVIDSDDWVDRQAFDHLMETLSECDSDIVYSNYYWVQNRTGKKSVEFKEPFAGVQYQKEYRIERIADRIFLKMHGYTIRTELLQKIPRIDEHCFYVDMEFVLFPVPYVRTITFIPDFVYMYRIGLSQQSMSPEKMRRNEVNYERVLNRLFDYYSECRTEGMSREKSTYMEHVLGRMVASRIKIFLYHPCSGQIRAQIKEFDDSIKTNYPEIYQAVKNNAVIWMRRTNYRIYPLAAKLFSWKERLK